jgi:nicotinate-nucleotide adenylyltransferase
MKVGIFSGTFDPIHSGHVEFARAAIKVGQLDEIIMVAEKVPYRKKPLASWNHRQAMVERATEDLEKVGHNYPFASELAKRHTVADMLEVTARHYPGSEIWFLAGSDVLEHMHLWHDIADHNDYGGFIVGLRRGHTKEWAQSKLSFMKKRGYEPRVLLFQSPKQDLGSTSIRIELSEGIDPNDLDDKVLSYIKTHKLYASDTAGSSLE